MASHTIHPDSHTHGLADDCERCAEHAEYPLRSLDNENIRALMERIVNDEKPRSLNEELAMDHVEEALYTAGQIATVDPRLLARYILSKWGVQMVAIGHEETA